MLIELDGKKPTIDETVFVAPNATVIGDVLIGEHSSIWFNAVVRGDMNSIRIGKYTNIQDLSIVHVTHNANVEIGDNVTIGHKALIHGCKIGNNCLIGMGSILMDDVEVGDNCIIGAGSLVTQGTKVPAGSLVYGSPAKMKRELMPDEIELIIESAGRYNETAKKYHGPSL